MEDTVVEVQVDLELQNRKIDRRFKNPPTAESEAFKLTPQYLAKLRRNRNHMARARLKETPEQQKARLENARVRAANVRKAETPEQRKARLERARLYKMELRAMETPEQRVIRLENARRRMNKMRLNETPEHRKIRLERIRLYNQEIRRKENSEERNSKLDAPQSYMSRVRQIETGDIAAGDNAIGDMAEGDNATGDMAEGDMTAGDMAAGDMTAGDMAAGDMVVEDITITLEPQSDASSSTEFNQTFDDKSIGEGSNDSLNGQEEACSQVDVNNKTAGYQSEDMAKNNVQDIMKILIAKQNFINNYYCEGPTQIKQPDIQSMTEMIESEDTPTYNEPCLDFQLNSITGNILPLDQEVQMLLEMGKASHNPIRFPCPKCKRIYRYAHSLQKHLNVHDTIE